MSNNRLAGRLIGLGVTGSIAAYKAVELLRLLQAEGADVAVMLSPSATRFVGPLTFAALSRHPVETELLELTADGRIGHIVVGESADAIVVAPATAHFLAAMAAGLSGDVVTATCLATRAPVVVAPAMDGDMWTHPATTGNVARLRDDFGYAIVDPEAGPLASGRSAVGRLADLPRIVDAVVAAIGDRPIREPDPAARPPIVAAARDADLADRHIVVTVGGTREAIDPVRFIGNRSTGRMGVAIAEDALARGARVTLIAANVEVGLPPSAEIIRVESTSDLRAALLRTVHAPDGAAGFDALVMAAAVADFRPIHPVESKLERGTGLSLELEPTPDLLGEVGRIAHGLDSEGSPTREPLRPRPFLVGFAAETGSLERAAEKLRRKGADLLVANDVAEPGSGFGTDTNRWRFLPPTVRARTCRCSPSARSRRACSTAWHRRWTSAMGRSRLDARPYRAGSQHERHLRHPRRLTIVDIAKLYADGKRIAMLTAYDFPTAKILDEAAIPMLLVGDSLGQVILGYESTVRVTMTEMVHHTKAVVRGTTSALIVADMPFLSYATPDEAIENAGIFLREAGAQAVKVEGGVRTARVIDALVRAGIPVMGHIGLTPQTINAVGKIRVQGRTRDEARSLIADALAVQEAGAFSMVLELVPEQLAAAITERLRIPTIGIGAGAGCSGQVQIITDLIGLGDFIPRHARPYAHVRDTIREAATAYAGDVAAGTFPGPEQTSRMDDAVLDEALGRGSSDQPPGSVPVGGIPLDRDL